MQPQRLAPVRNPPFRLQLVLPATADPSTTSHHQQHRWIPVQSVSSPPLLHYHHHNYQHQQQHQQRQPRQLYNQLLQLCRYRIQSTTELPAEVAADAWACIRTPEAAEATADIRPGSSDSGISVCSIDQNLQQQLQQRQQAEESETNSPACRICLTSLARVGPSAAVNCGHVACLPCLLAWYRTRSVCFCCRSDTTGFTLLYL